MMKKFYKILMLSVFLNMLCVFENNILKKINIISFSSDDIENFKYNSLFLECQYKIPIFRELSFIDIKNKKLKNNYLNKKINNFFLKKYLLKIKPIFHAEKFYINEECLFFLKKYSVIIKKNLKKKNNLYYVCRLNSYINNKK